MQTSPTPKNHLERIDVLRGMAILMVVCFHYLPSITGQYELGWQGMWRDFTDVKTPLMWALYPFTLGWSGVSLFFVISGFCIHYSFLKHQSSATRSAGFFKMFFWKRFWRIYPPYFLILVIFYGLTFRHSETSTAPINFWLHLLLVHNFNATTFSGINPSFWSLAVEMQFYLLFPVVLILRKKFGIQAVVGIFALISIAGRIFAAFFQNWAQSPTQFYWESTLILFIDWLMGAWLAERWLAGKRLVGVSKGQALAFGILMVASTLNKFSMAMIGFTGFSLWYVMLMELYIFSHRPFSWLEKMLIPIGLCSYSIYLWHQPLLGRALHWLHQLCGLSQTPAPSLGAMPLVVVAMIIIGWVSYKLIELPGIELGKRLQQKLKF